MKYYIIAGEASGDLHGSNLIKEIRKKDVDADIRAWGGDLMEKAGAVLVKHYRDLAFMGFAEVLMNLRTIFRNLRFCKKDISSFTPDVLILIDYPGFNLRIAEWAKKNKFKVVFYISPQVWAWKESRVPKMKKSIDKMLVILPFEKDYFKQRWNWDVDYVGHPLLEAVDNFKKSELLNPKTYFNSVIDESPQPIVALLPGSRKQEIQKKLPIMLEVSKHFPEYRFVVARAPGQTDSFYEHLLSDYSNVEAVTNTTYHLLNHARAGLVTSGTATLETALFGVPEVVCYKGNPISYQIAKKLIKIKYISLVNLIMDKPVVTELIQQDLNVKNLVRELGLLLHDQQKNSEIKRDYKQLREILSREGNASARAASLILEFMKQDST